MAIADGRGKTGSGLRWVCLAALAMAVACSSGGNDSAVDGVREPFTDDGPVAAAEAASHAADAAHVMLRASEACEAERPAADARCVARRQAAAFFQVLAVEVRRCAGDTWWDQVRRSALAAFDPVERADAEEGAQPAAPPPALPRC